MNCALPPEMTDQIIDHLHDDPESLGACSLTCRAWVTSAQSHIFHSVSLSMNWRERFLRLLDTSPHAAQHVKNLDIEEGRGRFPYEPKFVDEIIPLISPKLTNLEGLNLTNINFHELSAPAEAAFLQIFSTIRSLTLSSCVFEAFRDFTAFLGTRQRLEKLEMQALNWEDDPESDCTDSPTSHPPLMLRTVSLSYTTSTTRIIDWLVHYPTLHLTNVNIPCTLEDALGISRLFKSLGPSLERLDIGVLSALGMPHEQEIFEIVSISPNTSLRTLCFDNLILSSADPRPIRTTWVSLLLSQVTSLYLEEVTFRIYYNEVEELNALELERIDEIFGRLLFDRIHKIMFWLYGDGSRAEAKEEIRRKMRGIDARGLLLFR